MPSLKEEIKQTADFKNPHEEVLLNILRTNDRLQIRLTRLLRDYDITEPQYNVLRVLRGAKCPLPCLEVGSRLLTVVPAITGLLDRLAAAGFVMRRRSDTDRRVVLVEITESGLRLLKEIDRPLAKFQKDVLGQMSAKELKDTVRLMTKARARCT